MVLDINKAERHIRGGLATKEKYEHRLQHKDVTDRLTHINPALAAQARVVLDINKAERHIRGGLATKEKYEHRLQACSRENR